MLFNNVTVGVDKGNFQPETPKEGHFNHHIYPKHAAGPIRDITNKNSSLYTFNRCLTRAN